MRWGDADSCSALKILGKSKIALQHPERLLHFVMIDMYTHKEENKDGKEVQNLLLENNQCPLRLTRTMKCQTLDTESNIKCEPEETFCTQTRVCGTKCEPTNCETRHQKTIEGASLAGLSITEDKTTE